MKGEVADGTRTRDHRDHNPGLYQLSYRHRAHAKVSAGLATRFVPVRKVEQYLCGSRTNGPGWNRTTARSFEGCRSVR